MQAEGEVHALQKKMQQLEQENAALNREIAALNQQIKSADTMEDPESIELIEMRQAKDANLLLRKVILCQFQKK